MNNKKSKDLSNGVHTQEQTKRKLVRLFIIVIVVQFYPVPLLGLAAGQDTNRFADYLLLYTITSYTIIVLGIIIFQEKGLGVFQDNYSLWTIVAACFLAAVPGRENYAIYRIFLVLLGLRLAVYAITKRKSLKTPDLKSIFISLLWAASTVIIVALPIAYFSPKHTSVPPNFLTYLLNTSIYQIAFVTVIEEASFRGLLFSFLMMNNNEEQKALFIQAILFWGIHYLKMPNIPLFFLVIPLLTVSTTLIIGKYKTLYSSIMIHTFVNVLGSVLVAVLQNMKL